VRRRKYARGRAVREARVVRLSVAVVAAGADLLTTLPRVERVVNPCDFAVLAHDRVAPQQGPRDLGRPFRCCRGHLTEVSAE